MTTLTKTKPITIKADKEVLLSKLLRVIKYIPKKSVIPIMDHFFVSVENNKLTIIASNSDVTATIKGEVICRETVSFCVPARLLVETVKLFREPEITISLKSNYKIELKCGKSKYNLSGVDPKDFPKPVYPSCQYEISLNSKDFRDAIECTEPFTIKDGIETHFMGVSIAEKNREIAFVSTNKHVVSRNISPAKAIKDWADIILPNPAAKAFFEITNDKDVIDIYHNGKAVIAQSFDMTIISTLISAKFPPTDTLFNTEMTANIVLHTMEVKDAMERLKLYTSEDSSTIVMTIHGNTLEIYAEDLFNNHSGVETISLKETCPIDVKIGFSVEYFLQILSSISETEFLFSFKDEKSMGIIKAIAGENEKSNKTFLILPVLVQQIK